MRYGEIPVFEQRRTTRKTSFSSRKGKTAPQTYRELHVTATSVRLRKPIFQVVKGRQHHNIQGIACHHDERTTQEINFPGRIGKESNGEREKSLESRRYSQFKFDFRKLKTLLQDKNYRN